VSPLYTPEDFLDSRVGTLPAINNPRTAALTVQPGHRDQLPSDYGVARRVEPEAKFFNDFSRARACARAQGSVGSDSACQRMDRPICALLFVRALSRRVPDQRIIHALVQAANSFAVISLLIDFEIGPQKKLRCKLFDREPDRIRSVPKPSVSNWSSAGSLVATGEQLRLSIIIKAGRDLFGYHLFDRYYDFSDLNLFIQIGDCLSDSHQSNDIAYIWLKRGKVSCGA
jgi:hypothetical protein